MPRDWAPRRGHVPGICTDEVSMDRADTREEWSRMMVHSNLAMALLAMDDTARARPHLQAV